MKKLKIKILLFLFLAGAAGGFLAPETARAGFGISPPYVRTHKPIFPGSHYEQKITLLRSSAEDDMVAEVTVNTPELNGWISIVGGEAVDLPKGELQIPMVVAVDVPKDAIVGNYKGHINVRMSPKNAREQGGVAIALAARIEIDLDITNEVMADFTVRSIGIRDMEEFGWPWRWPIFSWFFYRVEAPIKVENTGNADTGPTEVQIDILDITKKKKLESRVDKKLEKVPPFVTDEIVASFPTVLGAGQYWGQIKVFNDNDIVYNNDVAFTIYKKGEMPGKNSLSIWAWALLAAYLAVCLIILAVLYRIKAWRYIFSVVMFLLWPLRFILRFLLKKWKRLKAGFWRWLHKKSSKYKD